MPNWDDPDDPVWETVASGWTFDLEQLVKFGREYADDESLDTFSAVEAGKRAMVARGYTLTDEWPEPRAGDAFHRNMSLSFYKPAPPASRGRMRAGGTRP
jgi:hypothetical protein